MTSIGTSTVALGIAVVLNDTLGMERPSRVFLVAILITAASNGLWPALFASLISALFYDFFFIPPPFSFSIATLEGVVDLLFFMATAAIVTALTTRVRRHAIEADKRALTAEKLSAFSRHLASALTSTDVLDTAAVQISALTGTGIALIIPDGDPPFVRACYPPLVHPAPEDVNAAIAWWALGAAEADGALFSSGGWLFKPLDGPSDGHIEATGLLAIRPLNGSDLRPDEDIEALLSALAHQTTLAIERCALVTRLEASRVRAEAERLRATVLSSISHDLRGPLASIVGAASSLEHHWSSLDEATRLTLVRNMRDEAGRLDGYVEKLLDMTCIESGALALKQEPVSVPEILDVALRQVARVTAGHRVNADIPADLKLVEADALLLRQVLCNLIENAAKYAPAGSQIRIVARDEHASVRISVLDEGVGIPDSEIERIFDKFHRAPEADRLAVGMGLGLTICRGFVEAMGGQIEAGNRDDRVGAVLAFTLPASAEPVFGAVEP